MVPDWHENSPLVTHLQSFCCSPDKEGVLAVMEELLTDTNVQVKPVIGRV